MLRILKWVDYPGLSKWAQCNHKGLYKREPKGSESVAGEMMTEARGWSDAKEGS